MHKIIDKDTLIRTNRGILSISLRNMISNSIKFTDPLGEIEVCYNEGILSITDTGIGIAEENLAKLFTSNLSPSIGTANEKGNGIGDSDFYVSKISYPKQHLDQVGRTKIELLDGLSSQPPDFFFRQFLCFKDREIRAVKIFYPCRNPFLLYRFFPY